MKESEQYSETQNTDENIKKAEADGWEWNTKVPGAWYHPVKKTWCHILPKYE